MLWICKPDKDGKQVCKPTCPEGVLVPDRDIDQAETETYWIQDRAGLRTCRNAFKTAVTFYENLRTELSAPEK
ncbi:hypothetical protein B1VFA_114 [Rhizobium phage B1VFA]|nr:hypothetical protein B1VFA_114 [Rhizobium phage B1VFA]